MARLTSRSRPSPVRPRPKNLRAEYASQRLLLRDAFQKALKLTDDPRLEDYEADDYVWDLMLSVLTRLTGSQDTSVLWFDPEQGPMTLHAADRIELRG